MEGRRAGRDAKELGRRPRIGNRAARRVVGRGAARACAGPRTGDQRAAWSGGGRGDPRTRSRGRPSQPPRPSADDDAADRPGRAGREDPRTGPEDERGGRALAWPVGRAAEWGAGTGERPGAGGPTQPPAARNRPGGDRARGAAQWTERGWGTEKG